MRILFVFLVSSVTAFSATQLSVTGLAKADAPVVTRSQRDLRAATKVEQWRYKRHNGHWWYYQVNGKWLFWNGRSWSDYTPTAYQRWYARSGPATESRYATGYRGTDYRRYSFSEDDTVPQVGQAIMGGASGSLEERVSRVGANW
jgi:hypothetical protein